MKTTSNHNFGVEPFPQFLMIGFAGKRLLPVAAQENLKNALLKEFTELEQSVDSHPLNLVGISALAMGADTIFAESLVSRGSLLRVILPERAEPFFNLEDFDHNSELLNRSKDLLVHENVIEKRVLGGDLSRDEGFSECAAEIVDACDILFVALTQAEWNRYLAWETELINAPEIEIPEEFYKGGSAATLCYARRIGKECRAFIVDGDCVCHHINEQRAPIKGNELKRAKGRKPVLAGEVGEALDGVFDPTKKPKSLRAFDYPQFVADVKDIADKKAMKGKNKFTIFTIAIVLIHIVATAVAASGFIWHDLHTFLAGFKALLLLVGLTMAAYVTIYRKKIQNKWVNERMLAEIMRSTEVLCGVTGGDKPIPCNLKHLRDFYLPEFKQLIRSLNILQLREIKKKPAVDCDLKDMTRIYCEDRIDNQLEYYSKMKRRGHRKAHIFEGLFFAFSSIALICACISFYIGFAGHVGEHEVLLIQLTTKFIPIVFPVLAAATIVLGSIYDLGRRCGSYTDMIAVLSQAREPVSNSVSPRSLAHRIHLLEHQLLQENVEAYSSMKNVKAG